MSMFWMPKLQEVFNVVPALSCNGVTQPYWEKNFVYPTGNSDQVPTKTSGPIAPTSSPSTCTGGSFGLGKGDGYNGACCNDQSDCLDDCLSGTCNGPINPNPTCVAGSFGLSKGDGYNGACCSDQSDCLDDCLSGKCNGPTNPNAVPTIAPTTCTVGSQGLGKGDGYNGACCNDQSDCLDNCLSGKCNGPVKTTTTKTATTSKATASCIAGVRGKKRGNGETGYCCSSSDDCVETCRSGTCGL